MKRRAKDIGAGLQVGLDDLEMAADIGGRGGLYRRGRRVVGITGGVQFAQHRLIDIGMKEREPAVMARPGRGARCRDQAGGGMRKG